uniref:Uncharacterized protein n=1 Tax=Mastacembelus armatus TaxID=205130 RepID=A0A3Q3M7M8_9TELE
QNHVTVKQCFSPGMARKGKETKVHMFLKAAAREGFSVLKRGGSALDAVEAAVRTMEDNPVFNADTSMLFTTALCS